MLTSLLRDRWQFSVSAYVTQGKRISYRNFFYSPPFWKNDPYLYSVMNAENRLRIQNKGRKKRPLCFYRCNSTKRPVALY